MLPDESYAKVGAAIVESRSRSIPLADALEEQGALSTPAGTARIRNEVLMLLSLAVEAETAEGIVRWYYKETRPVTPMEMWTAMRAWIDDFVSRQRT